MPHKSIDDDTLRIILTSRASHGVLGRQLNMHRSTISKIRLGKIHGTRLPELPRWQPSLTCGYCLHWRVDRSLCDLEFPEPRIEGLHFARECSSYMPR